MSLLRRCVATAAAAAGAGERAGEVQRVYALHRRGGRERARRRDGRGRERARTGGSTQRAAPFALLSASSSPAPPLCKNLPRCSPARREGGHAAAARAPRTYVCLAPPPPTEFACCTLSARRTATADRTGPPAPPANASLQNSRPCVRVSASAVRPRLFACRSVFAELASLTPSLQLQRHGWRPTRCCSLSSLQRVRRKLRSSHSLSFSRSPSSRQANRYPSDPHYLDGVLGIEGLWTLADSSQFRVKVGGGGGRTLYSTLLHIAALGGYESTVFAKRSPRAEFSTHCGRPRCSCTFSQGHRERDRQFVEW